jgi:hypothetical protein
MCVCVCVCVCVFVYISSGACRARLLCVSVKLSARTYLTVEQNRKKGRKGGGQEKTHPFGEATNVSRSS